MGVKGLWRILADSGVPVSLESLEGKVLGVDVSIWFHQAMHGYKGIGGSSVSNSHLLIMFHRICKLLFYRIRPIFIFDGSVPYLKKQTIAARRIRKEVALNNVRSTRERLLTNLLKSQAVRKALGKKGPGPSLHLVPKEVKREKDMFELPPIDPNDPIEQAFTADEHEDRKKPSNSSHANLNSFDLENKEFKDLSLYSQHEVLLDMQDTRKENSWGTLNEMPQEATNFSGFQMNRLLKRQKFQQTLDGVRDRIQTLHSAEMEARLLGELEDYVSNSRRIISEDSAHSILSKKSQKVDSICTKEEPYCSPSKQKCSKGDFLTELAKSGLIKDIIDDNLFIESESEGGTSENSDSDDYEGTEMPSKKKQKLEEDNFMRVMDCVLDDSELTQEEILAVIKQTKNEAVVTTSHNAQNRPSTSKEAFASSIVKDPKYFDSNETTDSSSPASLSGPIGLSASRSILKMNHSSNVDKESNVKAILGAKTNSLYLKIIQQKLDELVNQGDTSDISLDTRKALKKAHEAPKHATPKRKLSYKETLPEQNKAGQGVTISLDLAKTVKHHEDDLFNDIFPINMDSSTTKDTIFDNKTAIKSKAKEEELVRLNTIKCSERDLPSSTSEAVSFEKLALNNLTDSNGKISEELKAKVNELVKLEIESILRAEEKEKSDVSLNSNDSKKGTTSNDSKKGTTSSEAFDQEYSDKDEFSEAEEPFKATMSCYSNAFDSDSSSNDSFIEVPEPTKIHDPNSYFKADPFKENVPLGKPILNKGSSISDAKNKDVFDRKKLSGPQINKPNGFESLGSSNYDDHLNKNLFGSRMSKLCENNLDEFNLDNKGSNDKCNTVHNNFTELENGHEFDEDSPTSEDSLDVEEPSSIHITEDLSEQNLANENSCKMDTIPVSTDQLTKMESELASEQEKLYSSANNMERLASSMNNQMYSDAQELLKLFGLPYLVAPAEAEAQCAFLESAELSQGTITDDSDIFLFGGKRVYKNFFTQAKHVEMFNNDNIGHQLGLDRQKMVALSLLTGSDYTMGIESVGSVLAMEILSEFPGIGIDNLHSLKKWWEVAQKKPELTSPSKLKQRLKSLYIPESFPSETIFKAYLVPDVDESTEKFSWACPNPDKLKVFAMQRFGWSLSKIEEILDPLFKKIGTNLSQRRLDSYFDIKLAKDHKHASKRLKDAIAKMKGEEIKDPEKRPANTSRVQNRRASRTEAKRAKAHPPANEPEITLQNPNPSSSTQTRGASSSNAALEERGMESRPNPSVSKQQKRTKEYKKLLLLHQPENTQVQAHKQEMESRKRFAAQVLQSNKQKLKKS